MTITSPPAMASLKEIEIESTLVGMGTLKERSIPIIDLSDFENRRPQIMEELWDAATKEGFFQLRNHGIPDEDIDGVFEESKRFFALSESIKAKYPMGRNVGWESRSQLRPSTGTKDEKESYQITRGRMEGYFPSESELPGFQEAVLKFERQNWVLSQKLLACFAEKLNLSVEELRSGHHYASSNYQSTLRLLHYFALDESYDFDPSIWRAGAHTDFDSITLLHQRVGQGGLEVCPGVDRESHAWTPVVPEQYIITCNIGDMLQRWSDDQLKSTLHRVRMPRVGEDTGERYSVAFFLQGNEDAVLKGPNGVYPEITAGEFIEMRLKANYAAAQARVQSKDK